MNERADLFGITIKKFLDECQEQLESEIKLNSLERFHHTSCVEEQTPGSHRQIGTDIIESIQGEIK